MWVYQPKGKMSIPKRFTSKHQLNSVNTEDSTTVIQQGTRVIFLLPFINADEVIS